MGLLDGVFGAVGEFSAAAAQDKRNSNDKCLSTHGIKRT